MRINTFTDDALSDLDTVGLKGPASGRERGGGPGGRYGPG